LFGDLTIAPALLHSSLASVKPGWPFPSGFEKRSAAEASMVYSQSPSLVRDLDDLSLDGRARDLDAGRPERRMEIPSSNSPMGIPQSAGRRDPQPPRERPPVRRRPFRGLVRFVIAILIGVGGTLAWQSYGDMAREMLAARAPGLAEWLPPSMQSAAMAATSSASMQQFGPLASSLASNLDSVRRSLEQLAVKQDQMAQTIAAVQAADDDIRQKILSTAPVQQPASILQPKPIMQPRAEATAAQPPAPRRPPAAAGSPTR
jgi:hypothetical protein